MTKGRWLTAVAILAGELSAQYSAPSCLPVGFPPASLSLTQKPITRVLDVLGLSLPDLVTVRPDLGLAVDTVFVFVNQGPQLPATVTTLTSLPQTADILAGDVDGDGDVDMITARNGSISVFVRSGESFVRNDQFLVGMNIQNGELVDWDGDGDLDLFNGSRVAMNDGSGLFAAPAGPILGAIVTPKYRLRDADGDGDRDVFYFESAPGTAAVVYARHDPQALIASPALPTTTFGIPATLGVAMDLVDYDSDGIDDVVLYSGWGDIRTRRGLGNGAFAPVVPTVFSPALPNAGLGFVTLDVESFDFDGDGNLDVMCSFSTVFDVSYARPFAVNAAGTAVPLGSALPIGTAVQYVTSTAMGDGDLDGDADVTLTAFTPTVGFVVCTLTNLSSSVYTRSLTIVSGDAQSTGMAAPAAAPVVVALADASTGQPVSGANVEFEIHPSLQAGSSLTASTDALGRATFQPLGGSVPGTYPFVVRSAGAPPTYGSLQVIPAAILGVVSGDVQATNAGIPSKYPMVVEARDSSGLPIAGVHLSVSVSGPATLPIGAANLVTDANGRAAFTPIGGAVSGTATIVVNTGSGPYASSVVFHLGVRRLVATRPFPTTLLVNYGHEDGPTPIVFAAESGFTPQTTPFGTFATSVLAPAPGLIVFDGVGVFGPADPNFVANPVWFGGGAYPPAFNGFTFAFQVYCVDFYYPYPDYLVISNVVTLTL